MMIFQSQSNLQRLATFCQAHEGTIYLFSLAVGVFAWAAMMRTADRRIRSEAWIKYLGWMFFFVGCQYLILFVDWSTSHSSSPAEQTPTEQGPIQFLILQTLSIVTNLFAVAAARDIQNRNPLFPDLSKWLRKLRLDKSGRKKHLLPRWCVTLAIVSLLASVIPWAIAQSGYVRLFENLLPSSPSQYSRTHEVLSRAPESIFSAICLWWLGYAIFANLSNRRHPWLSLAAVTFAIIYAALQIGFGLSPVLSDWLIDQPTHEERVRLFDSFLTAVALPLKIILAYFSYELVARFFETLSGLRTLPDSGFQQKQDYLSSAGVVASIAERLKDQLSIRERVQKFLSKRRESQFQDGHMSVTRTQKDLKGPELRDATEDATETIDGGTSAGEQFPQRGFVNLCIKLPGENVDQTSGEIIKRVSCIFWPNNASEQRPKVFDWQPVDHSFSFIPGHEKPEDEEKNRPLITELRDHTLPLAGIVLTDEKIRELVWPEDGLELPAVSYDGTMKAIVSVPIKASDAAIGCLQIGRAKSPFSQMAIRQIREIANLLSPAVQAYRELAGLDLMSIRFAAAQAKEPTYSPERAITIIAETVHDIFAPTLTRLHLDFGFSDPILFVKSEPNREHVVQGLKRELKNKIWDDYPPTLTAEGEYRLLKKRLTARVTETLGQQPANNPPDRFMLGSFILAVNYNEDSYDRAALGTTYLHRKMASTLAADAFLDFQRDYYNDILKKLGKELSEKRLNIKDWFEPIERILTEEAQLSWVVARQRKRTLGNEQAICLIRQLHGSPYATHKKSERLDTIRPDRFILAEEKCNSRHVLVLRLPNAGASIWLGIKREGFGPELEFASPWKNFLVNFAQIADASLARITFPEKFQAHLEAAQLQGIIASMATTGTVIHQFRNMIAGQRTSLETLLHGIRIGELNGDEDYQGIIKGMYDASDKMLEMFQTISRLRQKTGVDQQPCRLMEAAEYARQLYEVQLKRMRIEMELQVDETVYVDVPFTVVALAFATLVGNATDAIKEQLARNSSGTGNGRIEIKAFARPNEVICQVTDNGPGISQIEHSKVFDPKRSTKRFGTGMGLYLISHSLSENRSYIELTSSNETGSVFTLKFPPAMKEAANVRSSNRESSDREINADATSKPKVSLNS